MKTKLPRKLKKRWKRVFGIDKYNVIMTQMIDRTKPYKFKKLK